jgi:NADH-quinone oxidoreductase subunit N
MPWRLGPRQVTALLLVDPWAVYSMGVLLAAAFAITLLAYAYFERQRIRQEEFYLLLLLATMGAMILAAATHFASFFLGLEVLSVSLYGLNAFLPDRRLAVEAGIKYLVLAASSTAFLLLGMALIYFGLGVMGFADVVARMNAFPAAAHSILLIFGLVLMLTAIGFKLALVPFHLWTPDVYEGSPAPATAVVASISKAGMFVLLLRLFHAASRVALHSIFVVLAVMAVASIIAGNLLALRQQRVKRILAYSSIAHMGYLLVALLAGGALGLQAGMFYLIAYLVTTLGAFGVIAVMSRPEQDADDLEDFRGLFWRRPMLAVVLTVMLLSLAGIPLTAGFLGKFYTVMAGSASSVWGLLLVLVAGSTVGLFYYLRVLLALYTRSGEEPGGRVVYLLPTMPLTGAVALIGLTVLVFWLGIVPNLFVHGIQTAVAALL